jgi:acyl carrier protein
VKVRRKHKMSSVREYILEALQREYGFKNGVDVDNINYIEEGYMDSLGMIRFITELEDTFQIEFSEDEMESASFQFVGGLIGLVEKKCRTQ